MLVFFVRNRMLSIYNSMKLLEYVRQGSEILARSYRPENMTLGFFSYRMHRSVSGQHFRNEFDYNYISFENELLKISCTTVSSQCHSCCAHVMS